MLYKTSQCNVLRTRHTIASLSFCGVFLMVRISFMFKSQISFVCRTRGVKEGVMDTLTVDPTQFEGSPERRRGSHTGSPAGKSNGRKESFKKSSSFC